jgi:hypothetical protein
MPPADPDSHREHHADRRDASKYVEAFDLLGFDREGPSDTRLRDRIFRWSAGQEMPDARELDPYIAAGLGSRLAPLTHPGFLGDTKDNPGKKPRAEKGWLDREYDPAETRQWLADLAGNVGLRLGDDLIAYDIDHPGTTRRGGPRTSSGAPSWSATTSTPEPLGFGPAAVDGTVSTASPPARGRGSSRPSSGRRSR